MSLTTTIRDAILDDLRDIATPTFEITLRKVYEEPIAMDKRIYPSAMLVPFEGGDAETAQLTKRQGEATQVFTVHVAVKSPTPLADAMKALDSVRNAVDRPTSNVLALSNVDQVKASHWEPDELTSEVIGNQGFGYLIDVEVEYHHVEGEA